MPLHGQFQTHLHSDHIDKKTSLLWLKDGRLKGHTESEVFAIQDQAVKTKYIEKHIYSTREDDKCRLCNEYKETIHHITSGCPIYAQSLYLMRHNNVARYIHHRIASSFSLLEDTSVAWYNHKPLPVIENDVIKVLWDFNIQTDKHVTSNRPDIVIVDKKEKSLKLIDVSIPNDINIVSKKIEKIEKYANLSIGLKELWGMKTVEIIPLVIGCTGTVDKKFVDYVNKFPVQLSTGELQKITILGTCYIVRRFLSSCV